jgi:serine/threonine protein kinase
MESLVAQVVDEFQARQRRGENPDPEEYAQRHPEAAGVLREVLAALRLVGLSAPAREYMPADEDELTGTLGDFRLLREAGRGGMGVVYEAEQISLGRRVALKVLPFAATMDPRHLQRFHNEARAAACLHHEHIVPVYSVGCERGVHFYAMQFIEGQTLAAFIHELRRQAGPAAPEPIRQGTHERVVGDADVALPTTPHSTGRAVIAAADTAPRADLSTQHSERGEEHFRSLARLGVQAAEALEHAHERGIIHRDIKPGNLLLDERGSLWVTDFGLAQAEQGEGNLTMTGDLLGTLRYTSPEQVLGKRVGIDHRADVYSLGVTLYELLTLRPAFAGNDRQELLRRVAFEEPAAPRKMDRNIPGELETIVLKAMEKNPADRYATAQELADDLRRFLQHEPIRATKPTWIRRASKWSRRHPAVVRSAMIVLVLLTAGSLSSTWLIWQEKMRTSQALVAEADARKRADEEKTNAQEREAEAKAALTYLESAFTAAARREGAMAHDERLSRQIKAKLPSIAKTYANQPLSEARLRRTLGLSFRYLGDEKIAAQQFETACSLYAKHRGTDDPDTLECMNYLANSYAALGRPPTP